MVEKQERAQKIKYDKCCGKKVTGGKVSASFVSGSPIWLVCCETCGNQLHLKTTIPQYRHSNLWNKMTRGEV